MADRRPGTSGADSAASVRTAGVSGRRLFANTAALVAGRNAIALGRLVVLAMVVRFLGADTFGEYVLLMTLLVIAEFFIDFGTTDVLVREIAREPGRATALLRRLAATKLVQVPFAFAVLGAMLLALQYPQQFVVAGLVAGLSLACSAGALVYRVVFRVHLTLERDVLAEFLSVVAMIVLVAAALLGGGGLVALAACYVGSRLVHVALCAWLGRAQYQPTLRGSTWLDVGTCLKASVVIGASGCLLVAYEALDVLLLSRMGTSLELAYYSAAQKLAWPLIMSLSAVSTTFYSVMAMHWPHGRKEFHGTLQRALDTVVVLAGLALSSLLAGPEFFLGLLGPALEPAAPALRVLAMMCVIKAVALTIGASLYVVRAQNALLALVAIALAVKAPALAVGTHAFGYEGLAWASFGMEAAVLAVILVLVRRRTGYQVRVLVPLMACAATTLAVLLAPAIATALPAPVQSFTAAMLGPVLFAATALVTGTVRLDALMSLMSRRPA